MHGIGKFVRILDSAIKTPGLTTEFEIILSVCML